MVFEIGNYRLKPYSNRLCWELFEYREIISNKGANAGSKRIDWVSTGFYPRSFESGLIMIYERLLMEGKPEPIESVEAAIKEAKAIEKRLRNEAKKVSNG